MKLKTLVYLFFGTLILFTGVSALQAQAQDADVGPVVDSSVIAEDSNATNEDMDESEDVDVEMTIEEPAQRNVPNPNVDASKLTLGASSTNLDELFKNVTPPPAPQLTPAKLPKSKKVIEKKTVFDRVNMTHLGTGLGFSDGGFTGSFGAHGQYGKKHNVRGEVLLGSDPMIRIRGSAENIPLRVAYKSVNNLGEIEVFLVPLSSNGQLTWVHNDPQNSYLELNPQVIAQVSGHTDRTATKVRFRVGAPIGIAHDADGTSGYFGGRVGFDFETSLDLAAWRDVVKEGACFKKADHLYTQADCHRDVEFTDAYKNHPKNDRLHLDLNYSFESSQYFLGSLNNGIGHQRFELMFRRSKIEDGVNAVGLKYESERRDILPVATENNADGQHEAFILQAKGTW